MVRGSERIYVKGHKWPPEGNETGAVRSAMAAAAATAPYSKSVTRITMRDAKYYPACANLLKEVAAGRGMSLLTSFPSPRPSGVFHQPARARSRAPTLRLGRYACVWVHPKPAPPRCTSLPCPSYVGARPSPPISPTSPTPS